MNRIFNLHSARTAASADELATDTLSKAVLNTGILAVGAARIRCKARKFVAIVTGKHLKQDFHDHVERHTSGQ
jgi:hypothetical protein